MAQVIRRRLVDTAWPHALFATGQAPWPALLGASADRLGGIRPGMGASAVVLALAALAWRGAVDGPATARSHPGPRTAGDPWPAQGTGPGPWTNGTQVSASPWTQEGPCRDARSTFVVPHAPKAPGLARRVAT